MSISTNVKHKKPDATNMRNVSTNLGISSVNANMTRATSAMERIATVSIFSLLFERPVQCSTTL